MTLLKVHLNSKFSHTGEMNLPPSRIHFPAPSERNTTQNCWEQTEYYPVATAWGQ